MPEFALLGAAGQTGMPIANALREAGLTYRAVGRNRTSLESAFGNDPNAEVATWNLDDPQSVRTAVRGIDTLFYLVGVDYDKFELHPKLMRTVLDAAIAERVPRMLLIGTVYPYGKPRSTPIRETHPRAPHTFKGRMRMEQEDALMAAHAAGSISATILTLPDFYGPDCPRSLVADAFAAAAAGRRAQLIGPIDLPHQYVFVPDIGRVAVALAREPRAYGRRWNFGGSGTITTRQFAERVFARAGRPARFTVANKAILRVMGLFNPMMRELVEMNYLQTEPVILDDADLRELLPDLHATSYGDGIDVTLKSLLTAR